MDFPSQLKALRKRKGINQRELSEALSISRSSLANWETGRTSPDLTMLVRLADYFGVSVDFLLARKGATESTTVIMPPRAQTVLVPLLSTLQPGVPISKQTDIADWYEVKSDGTPASELFFFPVSSDSMEPSIKKGSIVLVKEQHVVDNGELALLFTRSDKPELRRVYKYRRIMVLTCDNPHYPPILTRTAEVQVVGKVLEVRFHP